MGSYNATVKKKREVKQYGKKIYAGNI